MRAEGMKEKDGQAGELPVTIAYHILGEIRMRIITGEYGPGQPLREQDLEQQFGSSRGPIRESLRLLLQNGLVEHMPRKGFRVRTYTPTELEHIYRLRANLEALVLEELRGRDLAQLAGELEKSNRRMERFVNKRNKNGFFEENNHFHGLLLEACGNKPLRKVLTYVNEISLPVRYRLMGESMPSGRSVGYHDEIIGALRDGRIDKAITITRAHILENLDRAIRAYTALAEDAA